MSSLPILITNEVTVSGVCSPSLTAIFNRGIISTQPVSQDLKGDISKNKLLSMIQDPANQLRKDLAGDITGTLTGFVARAEKSVSIYAALYELTDAELVKSLADIGDKLISLKPQNLRSDKAFGWVQCAQMFNELRSKALLSQLQKTGTSLGTDISLA
jgi:hypothetical protein